MVDFFELYLHHHNHIVIKITFTAQSCPFDHPIEIISLTSQNFINILKVDTINDKIDNLQKNRYFMIRTMSLLSKVVNYNLVIVPFWEVKSLFEVLSPQSHPNLLNLLSIYPLLIPCHYLTFLSMEGT